MSDGDDDFGNMLKSVLMSQLRQQETPNLSVRAQLVELNDYNLDMQTWLARPCPFKVGDIVVGTGGRYKYPSDKVPGIVIKVFEEQDKLSTRDGSVVQDADMVIAIIHPSDNSKTMYRVNSDFMKHQK
jgi:hypothetical protein